MNHRLEQIRQRAEKATPGPWYSAARQGDDWESVVALDERYEVCQCFHDRRYLEQCDATTKFIAHARTDIPYLLTLAESAGKLAEALEKIRHDAELIADKFVCEKSCRAAATDHNFCTCGRRETYLMAEQIANGADAALASYREAVKGTTK